jgi:hypothetical protein
MQIKKILIASGKIRNLDVSIFHPLRVLSPKPRELQKQLAAMSHSLTLTRMTRQM